MNDSYRYPKYYSRNNEYSRDIKDVKFGTILSAYGIKSVVVGLNEKGVLTRYESGAEDFISWECLEYRLKTGDTSIRLGCNERR